MCYDETEDDPWQFLPSLQQDCLADEMKPARVDTAKYVLKNLTESNAWNFIAIDPCLSLLPRKQEKADLLKIAAMGHSKVSLNLGSCQGPQHGFIKSGQLPGATARFH